MTITENLGLWRAVYRTWEPDQEPPGPASTQAWLRWTTIVATEGA